MKFSDLPIGATFLDSDGHDAELCQKVSSTHAISRFCARGWCESWRADEQVWPAYADLSQPAALEAVDSAISQLLGE